MLESANGPLPAKSASSVLVAFSGKGDTPDGISPAVVALAIAALGAMQGGQTRDAWMEFVKL
jgi:hypothetical protein